MASVVVASLVDLMALLEAKKEDLDTNNTELAEIGDTKDEKEEEGAQRRLGIAFFECDDPFAPEKAPLEEGERAIDTPNSTPPRGACSKRRGLRVLRAMEPGDVAIEVPLTCCLLEAPQDSLLRRVDLLSETNAVENTKKDTLLAQKRPLEGDLPLVLELLREVLKGKESRFAQYVSTLPPLREFTVEGSERQFAGKDGFDAFDGFPVLARLTTASDKGTGGAAAPDLAAEIARFFASRLADAEQSFGAPWTWLVEEVALLRGTAAFERTQGVQRSLVAAYNVCRRMAVDDPSVPCVGFAKFLWATHAVMSRGFALQCPGVTSVVTGVVPALVPFCDMANVRFGLAFLIS
jgi:hypothetical protein